MVRVSRGGPPKGPGGGGGGGFEPGPEEEEEGRFNRVSLEDVYLSLKCLTVWSFERLSD